MIDWSVFDKYPESDCYCLCGVIFRSHGKFIIPTGLISRKPCPVCGKNDLSRISSDPEIYEIK